MARQPHTVVLTGSTGMTGQHMRTLLKARGIRCIAVSRALWDLREWRTPEEVTSLFAGAEAVLHFGATVPVPGSPHASRDVFDANVRACLCVGEWALLHEIPLVYLSGATAYAAPCRPGIEETDETTTRGLGGFYGFSKYLGEQVLDHLVGDGLHMCVLRPSSIYGTGMHPSKMIASFLARAARGETIKISPPVDDRVNLVHAADVAEAALVALEAKAWGIFNIAGPRVVSVLEIAETCVEVTGRGAIEVTDTPAPRPPTVRFDLDCGKAAAAFAYQPRVHLQEGLGRMLEGRT